MPRLRKKMKSIDPKKESEQRERADDVLENFVEFLKYKETEANKNSSKPHGSRNPKYSNNTQ